MTVYRIAKQEPIDKHESLPQLSYRAARAAYDAAYATYMGIVRTIPLPREDAPDEEWDALANETTRVEFECDLPALTTRLRAAERDLLEWAQTRIKFQEGYRKNSQLLDELFASVHRLSPSKRDAMIAICLKLS